jgi:sugar lactone lactonase YvrE
MTQSTQVSTQVPARPPIDPVVWAPPPVPARARARQSDPPMPEPALVQINGRGPEDVVVDAEGRLLTGVEDGRILRLTADGARIEVVADTGGRPLGLERAGDGRLVVCDAYRGLLRVDPDRGTVETLVHEFGGEPLRLCDNAAVAADGAVYFSDSSRRFGLRHWKADLLEHSGTGRLLRRDPNGAVEVVLDGLQFANGVALAADGSFVAVAETGAYRVSRLWLSGPKAGQRDLLVDNLPGFPDNLSTGSDGRIWVALPSPRDPVLDWAHARPPAVRKLVWALPDRLQPGPKHTAWVQAVDGTGAVVADLQTIGEQYRMVTGVREHAGRLYLGSLTERAIAVTTLDVASSPSSPRRS